jgi:hypothetical protein
MRKTLFGLSKILVYLNYLIYYQNSKRDFEEKSKLVSKPERVIDDDFCANGSYREA